MRFLSPRGLTKWQYWTNIGHRFKISGSYVMSVTILFLIARWCNFELKIYIDRFCESECTFLDIKFSLDFHFVSYQTNIFSAVLIPIFDFCRSFAYDKRGKSWLYH